MKISLGNILTMIAMLAGGFWAYTDIMVKLTEISGHVRENRVLIDAMLNNDKARIETWWKHYDRDFAKKRGKNGKD